MVAPAVMKAAAIEYDTMVRNCLSAIINPRSKPLHVLPDEEDEDAFGNAERHLAWAQATLPVRMGGMGLGSAELGGNAAFTAAWADFLVFMHREPQLFVDVRPAISERALEAADTPPIAHLQSAWSALEEQLSRAPSGERTTTIPGSAALTEIFGDGVVSPVELAKAKTGRQHALTTAMWDCFLLNMRLESSRCTGYYQVLSGDDEIRFTSCSGPEAAFVAQVPTRPEYRLNSVEWRVLACDRLHVPHEFLLSGPQVCDCHRQFAEISRKLEHNLRANVRPQRPQRRRNPPKPVDPHGVHDKRCKHANPLVRHNKMQTAAMPALRKKELVARIAVVGTLRKDDRDPSQKKPDIEIDNLAPDGLQTIVDFGCVDPTVDTYKTKKSREEKGVAADTYGRSKSGGENGYLNTIKKKKLTLHYQGFITESYGAFGTEAWSFINKVAKIGAGGGDPFAYSPWGRPDWKRHFILSIGFAIQRGNAAMLVRSDLRRRTNSRSFRTSGPRY